jgi:hypothetical protein
LPLSCNTAAAGLRLDAGLHRRLIDTGICHRLLNAWILHRHLDAGAP